MFKSRCIRRSINNGILNISVPQVILNQPGVTALICQRVAACMPEHMRVYVDINVRYFSCLTKYSV